MFQLYTTPHNALESRVIVLDLDDWQSGITVLNSSTIYNSEVSYWIGGAPGGTPPSALQSVFLVRADAARLNKHTLHQVVFSAALSLELSVDAPISVSLIRVEATTSTPTSISAFSNMIMRPVVAQQAFNAGFDIYQVSFDDCASFNAYSLTEDNYVFFGVFLRSNGVPTNITGALSMRCNYQEMIPFQPLKA